MTPEERKQILREKYGLDDAKKSKTKKSQEIEVDDDEDKDTKKRGSAAKKVAAAAIGVGAGVLAIGGIKAAVESNQNNTSNDNAITVDNDTEKTGTDAEIEAENLRIEEMKEQLFEASEMLSSEQTRLFATEGLEGKFRDLIFDVDHDGTEEDIADQLINKLTSYQARLTEISAIQDDTEKAVQFALFKQEMKNDKIIFNTNDSSNVYENKIKIIQDGYNQNEDKVARASYDEIAHLYGEDPVFTGNVLDSVQALTNLKDGKDLDMKIVAFETGTTLDADGRFVNGDSLLNSQEITLDYVAKREQVKTVTKTVTNTKTVYVPVAVPTQTPVQTPTIPTPGPGIQDPIPDPKPDPKPDQKSNEETQVVVDPVIPSVQTDDTEDKLPETVKENSETTVVTPQEETYSDTATVPVTSEAIYTGHEVTQSFDFETVNAAIESACEDIAITEVQEETATESSVEETNEAQPEVSVDEETQIG